MVEIPGAFELCIRVRAWSNNLPAGGVDPQDFSNPLQCSKSRVRMHLRQALCLIYLLHRLFVRPLAPFPSCSPGSLINLPRPGTSFQLIVLRCRHSVPYYGLTALPRPERTSTRIRSLRSAPNTAPGIPLRHRCQPARYFSDHTEATPNQSRLQP